MLIELFCQHQPLLVCLCWSRSDLVVFVFQCASLLEWGESFVFHVMSREFQLEQPKPSVTCQHGVDRRICDAKVQKCTHTHAHTRTQFSKWLLNWESVCVSVWVACRSPWSLSHIRGSEVHHDSTDGWWSTDFHCWTWLCCQCQG